MSDIIPQVLSAGAFAPFGDVLAFDSKRARSVNDGNALRGDFVANLAFSAGDSRLALFRVEARSLPLTISVLEQHPHSSQVFYPVSAERFLVVVAPTMAGGAPDVGNARGFVGQRGQGINYHAGVWHAPIVALDADGDFLMLIWEQDLPADCIIEPLAVPLHVASDRL